MVFHLARSWFRRSSSWLFLGLLLAIALPVSAAPVEESPEESAPAEEETVAPDLSMIEAEPGIDGNGDPVTTEESSIDYYAEASEAIDRAILAELEARYNSQEETTLSPEEDFLLDASLTKVVAAPAAVNDRAVHTMPVSEAYQIELDGVQYYCWFPNGARVQVTDEGDIYNESGSNITGLISTSLTGVNLSGYNDFVTFAPLLATSSNNNAYRYGSRVYITDYYVSGNTLYNNVSYVQSAKMIKAPGAGYGFNSYQFVVYAGLCLICVLLLLRGGHKN